MLDQSESLPHTVRLNVPGRIRHPSIRGCLLIGPLRSMFLSVIFDQNGVQVRWLSGAVYMEKDGYGLLIDAPATAVSLLEDRLPHIQSIILTSGGIASVGGLVPVLCALEATRPVDLPLSLHFAFGEERGAMMAEAWVRGWPCGYPLTLDGEVPGGRFDAGPFSIVTSGLKCGEPEWGMKRIRPTIGLALTISAGDVTVARVPATRSTPMVSKLCRDRDLAIVDVGVIPWPESSTPWRMTVDQAVSRGSGAKCLILVGDDGVLVGPDGWQ